MAQRPTRTEFTALALTEMLRRKGLTLEYVRSWEPTPPWYVRLWWTPQERADFERWFVAQARLAFPDAKTSDIETSFALFDLMYGLHEVARCEGNCSAPEHLGPKVVAALATAAGQAA